MINKHTKLFLLITIIIAIVGVFSSMYFYYKYKALTANTDVEVAKQTAQLVSTLGKLIELPQGETPTVATISDKEKLKGQDFFEQAENGDILFAYTTTMKAILYRPSTNKIINVAPITIDKQKNLAQGTTQSNPTMAAHKHTVAYYNGTKTIGAASLMEKTVNNTYKDYATKLIANASRTDYSETLVIDISGTHTQEAVGLAKLLDGKVGTLPQGEVVPDADLLIISGK